MSLLEVTLVLSGQEVVVVGTWAAILQTAADRLGCSKEDVVFKMRRDGKLKEIYSKTPTGWRRFFETRQPVHVFVREAGKKRKSTLYDDRNRATPESQLSSSLDTPPRPSALKKSRSSDGSRGSASREYGGSSSTNQADDCSHMAYTTKDDHIMWEKFITLLKRMPPPDTGYSHTQKERLFEDIAMHAFNGKRSTAAMRTRVRERIVVAAQKGQLAGDKLRSRYEALFPVIFRNLPSNGERSGARNTVNDSSSDSSDSDSTPPPSTRAATSTGPRAPPTISEHNPFASIPSAVPPRRTAIPSWSKEGRALRRPPMQDPLAPLPRPPLVDTSKSLPSSVSSSGIGQDGPSQSGIEGDRLSSTMPYSGPERAEAGTQKGKTTSYSTAQTGTPSLNSTGTTSTAAPAIVSPAPPLASQVGSMSLGEASSLTKAKEGGQGTDDAIVVKDESEDELMDEVIAVSSNIKPTATRTTTAPDRAGSVKDEHQGAREAVRDYLAPLFPIDGIFTLPPIDWALSLANRLKTDTLRGVNDPAARLEILVACLDEFFYFSYHKINSSYSVQRASIAIALLLLDLFHAFGDFEEVQAALVGLFFTRIFTKDAPKPGAAQAWMAYDICAAISLVFPCRPAWLITLIFDRCRHLRIEEVPPPVDDVSLTFSRLQVLLEKLAACRAFFEREPRLKLLCKTVHRPFIDSETLSNLQAFHRQTRSRLSASARAVVETTLAKIDQLNKEANTREVQRKADEERFFADQLLLISSPHPISVAAVEELIKEYSLQSQIRNGPMRKKFDSTRETWNLWILQFKSQERKQDAIVKLRDRPPNQEVQVLEKCEQTHSMCPSLGHEEQRRWHRLRCDLHLHREYHRRSVDRIKKEAPASVPL